MSFAIVPYSDVHEDRIRTLLSSLSELYPGSESWLTRRLSQVGSGIADGFVAVSDQNEVVGVALGVYKQGKAAYKISTLYIKQGFRAHGLGSLLLKEMCTVAMRVDAPVTYITVASTVKNDLEPLLTNYGFLQLLSVDGKYGPSRTEHVFIRNNR